MLGMAAAAAAAAAACPAHALPHVHTGPGTALALLLPPTPAAPPLDCPLQLGGLVLAEGRVAEMGTGEGKTLVATLPAYVNALSGGWVG